MFRRRKLIVITITAAIGLLAGAGFIAVVEFLPTLVLPHGGWNHVSSDMWTRLIVSAAAGGGIGLIAGAAIVACWRS